MDQISKPVDLKRKCE